MLRKLAPPSNQTTTEVVLQEGISEATLYNWRNAARQEGAPYARPLHLTRRLVQQRQVQDCSGNPNLLQAELSEHRRKRGLYQQQMDTWAAACIAGNDLAGQQAQRQQHTRKTDKKRIKELERELERKEKALAETAACWCYQKSSRRSGTPTTRTIDSPPGSPTHRDID